MRLRIEHRGSRLCLTLLATLIVAFVLPAQVVLQTDAKSVALAADDVTTIDQIDISEPVIALTFDAGADRGFAEEILDTLDGEDVRASFGMTGVWAEQNSDLVRRMADEGHHLMNHSWDHPSFVTISSLERADQLRRTDELVQTLTGQTTKPYFRPPFGAYDESVLIDLAANGYFYNVMWTVDTLGWNGYSASQIFTRVLNGAAPGAIILMHVGAQSQDAIALDDIITVLRARGYRFQTVQELIGSQVPNPSQYFPETGFEVDGPFYRYWLNHGGLDIFGFPISGTFTQDGRTVQYFERARFEWHEEYAGTDSAVLLGLLGNEITQARRLAGEAPFQSVDAETDANCTFFDATGHRLCFGFRDYWTASGGLAIFGYPISEEFRELNPDDGRLYTVQYFERARFEWHPDYRGTPYEILLGRLGWQVMTE